MDETITDVPVAVTAVVDVPLKQASYVEHYYPKLASHGKQIPRINNMHKIVKKIVEEVHLPGVIALEAPLLSALVGLATVPGIVPEVVDKWIEKAAAISDEIAGAPLVLAEHLLPIVAETPIVVGPAKAIIAAMPAAKVLVPKLPKVF